MRATATHSLNPKARNLLYGMPLLKVKSRNMLSEGRPATMALLSKVDILAANDMITKDVEVPEWGGEVRVKTMTAAERDAFENSIAGMKNGKRKENYENFRARFIAHCTIDELGNRQFVSEDDVKALGRKSVKAIQRVFDAAQELNAMTDKDVEELVEDFDESPDESSSSV